MVGRLVHSADFVRVLAAPIRSRSAHFAVHHVTSAPTPSGRRRNDAAAPDFSTAGADNIAQSVDRCWLGSVVPKRHAKRAVTRSLLKRQIRGAMARHADLLRPGLWVVRLRAPFERSTFPSAASDALRHAARAELDVLLGRAAG